MAQTFHPSMNTLSRLSIFGAAFAAAAGLYFAYVLMRSPYQTLVRVVKEQPVQFSHEHHVAGLGIDCRYCHTSVEKSASAGMPPTETCMTCHSQVWTESPLLAPVRASYRENAPIAWNRVHDLPDFVYFHHGVHVQKGVGCVQCHGRVDKMPLVWKEQPLTMEWCLECHRNPKPRIGPKDEVFNLAYQPTPPSGLASLAPVDHHAAQKGGLTNCSACHR